MSNRSHLNGARKQRTEYPVTRERFCAVWQQAETLQEVCTRLKMPPTVAMSRASQYRAAGVPLKKFLGGRRKTAIMPQIQPQELAPLLEQIKLDRLTPELERRQVLQHIIDELAAIMRAEMSPKSNQ